MKKKKHSRPAFVASRLMESSLSPCDRTCPHRAKVVEVFKAWPFASTSTILICTDAWSFEVINRSTGMILDHNLGAQEYFGRTGC